MLWHARVESRGHELEPAENRIRVAIPPDDVTITLRERVERREHVPTIEELANEERLRKKRVRDARFGIWSNALIRSSTLSARVNLVLRSPKSMSEVFGATGKTGGVKD